MEKNVWLYFNTTADDDNIGAGTIGVAATNCMYPAKNLVGMTPTADSELTLYFKSMKNGTYQKADTVALTLATANTHLDVMKAILRKANSTRPTFNGFARIADDLTTIVGGSADTSLSGYITDNSQESGTISACGAISIQTPTNGTVTATDAGATTGTITCGGFYTVSADSDANHIVILPAPVPGTEVWLNTSGDSTGFELRSSAPATVKINGGSGSNAESAIPTAAKLVRCVCITATEWICSMWDADGDEAKVEAAA